MAYTSQDYDSGSISKFNGGVFQTMRIHKQLELVNTFNSNRTSFNLEWNEYNYLLLFQSLNSLMNNEAWGKMSDEEKKKGNDMSEGISAFIRKYPIHIKKISLRGTNKEVIDKETWYILDKALTNYLRFISETLNNRGFNSPDYDDDDDEL